MLNTLHVRIAFQSSDPVEVGVSLLVDNVALELNEHREIRLVPLPETLLPRREGVFFRDIIGVTIVDSDGN